MYIALSRTPPTHMFLSSVETEESTFIKSPQSFRQFANRYTSALIDTTRIMKTYRRSIKRILMMASENDSTLKEDFYNIAEISEKLARILINNGYSHDYIKVACKEFRDGIDYPMANATLVADINAALA